MVDWSYNYKCIDAKDLPSDGKVTLTLAEDCQQAFIDNGLFSWLEIEMMQGTKELLSDGRMKFIFRVSPEKGKLLADMFIQGVLPQN